MTTVSVLPMNGDNNRPATSLNGNTYHVNGTLSHSSGEEKQQDRYLSCRQRWSYSVGHVLNDLCASMWFSYVLVFMTDVNGFSGATAGTLMLIGQVSDGIVTPFIGFGCDKKPNWFLCRSYGYRKTWHLLGTLCGMITFPFIFNLCINCNDASEIVRLGYYAFFIVFLQVGFSSVQIAHMALLTDLTPSSSERVGLYAYRHAFAIVANLFVFLTMFVYIKIEKGDDHHFSPRDATMFRNVIFIFMGVGSICSLIFHVGVREKKEPLVEEDAKTRNIETNLVSLSGDSTATASAEEPKKSVRWYYWLLEVQFWLVCLIHLGTKLTINITETYLVKYVTETLGKEKSASAYIPLSVNIFSFATSFLMKMTNNWLGKRLTYLVGAITALAACTWIFFGDNRESYINYEIWPVTIMIGLSSTTLEVTSMGIISDLIGDNSNSGAFVFGTISLFEKISNGVAVVMLERLKTCNEQEHECGSFYRNNMSLVCGVCVLVALCGLLFQRKIKLDVSRTHNRLNFFKRWTNYKK